jgi:hypothetical protein
MTHPHNKDPQTHELPPELQDVGVTPEDLAFFASPEIDEEPDISGATGDLAKTAFSSPEHVRSLELSATEDDEFVESLQSIRDKLDLPENAEVIYPGSGDHIGVARVFGRDHVVHVDPDEHAINVLEHHGFKAVAEKISDYSPRDRSDAIVALNSYGRLTEEDVNRLLKDGGYLVTNNYTGWANDAASLENLSLVGGMIPSYSDGAYYEGDDLPEGATDIVTRYYRFPKEGGVFPAKEGEPGAEPDRSARYPSGLFVFRKK